jgi:hypothetical protein
MAALVDDGAIIVIGLCNGVAVKSERKRKRKNSRECQPFRSELFSSSRSIVYRKFEDNSRNR